MPADAKDIESCSMAAAESSCILWKAGLVKAQKAFHTTCPPTSVTFWVALGHRLDAHGGLLWAPALQGITCLHGLKETTVSGLLLNVYTLSQGFGSLLSLVVLSHTPTNFSSDCPGWGAGGSRACWEQWTRYRGAVGQKSLLRQCSVTLNGTVLSWFSWTWELLSAPSCLNHAE